jgi:hypothetical protein
MSTAHPTAAKTPSAVDADTLRTYDRDGIVLLRGAFAEWVEPLIGAIDRVVQRSHEPGYALDREFRLSPQNPLHVSGGRGGVTVGGTMALGVIAHDPVFERWILESPAARLIGEVTRSSLVRYWTDAVFIKEGAGDGRRTDSGDDAAIGDATPWHNDYCTWPFRGEKLPILWIALTDVGPDDAPLLTVRGTHRDPWRYYSPMSPRGLAVTHEYHAWEELLAKPHAPDAQIDAWTVRAGDALIMHSKLIHASKPRMNRAPGRRVSFSTRWLGDDAVWAPDPYTFRIERLLADPRMRHGAAPPDALFPPVWTAPRKAA